MRRREFLYAIGAATAWPLAARAQQPGRVYRLGIMVPSSRQSPANVAFFDELRLNGFIEGQNLVVIDGSFDDRNDQLAEQAVAMVQAVPDAIVASPMQLRALQSTTRTVPLIGMTEDMVAEKFVASLARPGGNITGISILSPELNGKRQDLLIEAVPGARRMTVLADSNVTPPRDLQALQDAARRRGVELSVLSVARFEDVVPGINGAKATGAEALNILASPLFGGGPGGRNNRIVMESVAAVRIPAIYQWPESAEEGGFAAYGPSFVQMFRQRARIVVKVLRGAKPADLPVEQPTRFELVINLKTAKAIGHEIPAGLVLRADKLIE
jgi:putative tryptophan/tyrosine transport system substrate-binding protein